MAYTKETLVSAEKAKVILLSVGALDAYIDGQDYYLCSDEDGGEFLVGYGEDEPVAENKSNTSWHSPGYVTAR